MKNKLLKILNLEQSEIKIVALLIVYSFFMGAAIAFFVSSATSLFLIEFHRNMLPVTFIVSGVIVYLIGLIFSYLQKKIKFSRLANLSVSFLFVSSTLFLIYYFVAPTGWLVFILYCWIRVFAYIHAVIFWGISAKLFNLRQGKRIYGLIGSGEVLSSIITFLSIPLILQVLKTEDLLIFANISLIFAFILVFIIVANNKEKLAIKKISATKSENNTRVKVSFFANKYFTFIFLIALFPVLAQFLVEFIFQAQIKIQFPIKDSLTGFVALFFGFTSVVEFILKTFVAGRLISKYGIKLGLIVFPLVLMISFFLASLSGIFYGTLTIFFSAVTLGRLFTRAARTSFQDPASQLLFQPIQADIRSEFQSKIEGGPKAFGNIIAGIIIGALAFIPSLTLVHFSIILFVIVLIWFKVSLDTYKEYKKSIENVLNPDSNETILKVTENEKITDLIKMLTENETNFSSFVNLAYKLEPINTDKVLTKLYGSQNQDNKKIIIEKYIKLYKLKELRNILELEMKIQDTTLIQHLNISIDQLSEIEFSEIERKTKSEDIEEKIHAAQWLTNSKRYNAIMLNFNLIQENNIEVRKNAVKNVANFEDIFLRTKILNELTNHYLRITTSKTVATFGESFLQELIKFYNKNIRNAELQTIILKIIGEIGGSKAVYFLRSKINSQNTLIRNTAIRTLIEMEYVANRTETSFIYAILEQEIENIVWISLCYIEMEKNESSDLHEALSNELSQKINNIFNLLSIIYTKKNIDIIKSNLASTTGNSKGYALEILDMMFAEEFKNLVLPLFENTNYTDIYNVYKDDFPQKKLSYKDRIKEIINKNVNQISNYTKATALFELAKFNDDDTVNTMICFFSNPFKIIKEAAAYNLHLLNETVFLEQLIKLKTDDKINLKNFNNKVFKSANNCLFIFEKIKILKQTKLFENVFENEITMISEKANDFIIKKQEEININIKNNFYYIFSGEIILYDNNQQITVTKNYFIHRTLNEENINSMKIKAIENTNMLEINYDLFLNLIADNQLIKENYFKFLNSNLYV